MPTYRTIGKILELGRGEILWKYLNPTEADTRSFPIDTFPDVLSKDYLRSISFLAKKDIRAFYLPFFGKKEYSVKPLYDPKELLKIAPIEELAQLITVEDPDLPLPLVKYLIPIFLAKGNIVVFNNLYRQISPKEFVDSPLGISKILKDRVIIQWFSAKGKPIYTSERLEYDADAMVSERFLNLLGPWSLSKLIGTPWEPMLQRLPLIKTVSSVNMEQYFAYLLDCPIEYYLHFLRFPPPLPNIDILVTSTWLERKDRDEILERAQADISYILYLSINGTLFESSEGITFETERVVRGSPMASSMALPDTLLTRLRGSRWFSHFGQTYEEERYRQIRFFWAMYRASQKDSENILLLLSEINFRSIASVYIEDPKIIEAIPKDHRSMNNYDVAELFTKLISKEDAEAILAIAKRLIPGSETFVTLMLQIDNKAKFTLFRKMNKIDPVLSGRLVTRSPDYTLSKILEGDNAGFFTRYIFQNVPEDFGGDDMEIVDKLLDSIGYLDDFPERIRFKWLVKAIDEDNTKIVSSIMLPGEVTWSEKLFEYALYNQRRLVTIWLLENLINKYHDIDREYYLWRPRITEKTLAFARSLDWLRPTLTKMGLA